MWNRVEFKARGKDAMRANYGECVVVALLMGIIGTISSANSSAREAADTAQSIIGNYGDSGMIQYRSNIHSINALLATSILGGIAAVISLAAFLLRMLVENVLMVGGSHFFILNQTSKPGVSTVLNGFKSGHYGNIVITMFLRNLFIALWSCLLVIPGIIKHYEYLMVPYILAENPGMDRREVFGISKEMMNGHKMDAFVLDLSFIGWNILSAFTLGLLNLLYVAPYKQATLAEVYSFNKRKAFESGYIK